MTNQSQHSARKGAAKHQVRSRHNREEIYGRHCKKTAAVLHFNDTKLQHNSPVILDYWFIFINAEKKLTRLSLPVFIVCYWDTRSWFALRSIGRSSTLQSHHGRYHTGSFDWVATPHSNAKYFKFTLKGSHSIICSDSNNGIYYWIFHWFQDNCL